jgi:hypothetical protein
MHITALVHQTDHPTLTVRIDFPLHRTDPNESHSQPERKKSPPLQPRFEVRSIPHPSRFTLSKHSSRGLLHWRARPRPASSTGAPHPGMPPPPARSAPGLPPLPASSSPCLDLSPRGRLRPASPAVRLLPSRSTTRPIACLHGFPLPAGSAWC